MPGKHSQTHRIRKLQSYLFTDTLVYIIAHCSGPPRTYVDFSKISKADWSMLEWLLLLMLHIVMKIWFHVAYFYLWCLLVLYLLYSHVTRNRLNPFKPNGISHCYQLDLSIFVLRVFGWYFFIVIPILIEQSISKIRRRVLWCLIWVCTLCLFTTKKDASHNMG